MRRQRRVAGQATRHRVEHGATRAATTMCHRESAVSLAPRMLRRTRLPARLLIAAGKRHYNQIVRRSAPARRPEHPEAPADASPRHPAFQVALHLGPDHHTR